MLHDIVKKDATNRSVAVRIIDAVTGQPELGVLYNTSGIDLWYRREGAVKTSITEATLAALTTAHADGGFLEVGDGVYRLDLPDAAFATGANYVDFGGTVTGMVVIGGRVRLVDVDLEDAVRAGLTALPNAAADAAGGLPVSDAGGLDLDAALVDGTGLTEAGGTGDHLTAVGLTGVDETALQAIIDDLEDGGRLDALIDAILLDTGTTLDTVVDSILSAVQGLNDLSAAQVNAELVDVLTVDTQALPGQGAPTVTPTLAAAILYLYKAWRNKHTQDASEYVLFADDGTTEDQKATVADSAGTLTRGEVATGA